MPSDPVAILRSAFGYPGFRPGQEELVRAVLDGRDALGVLPTGGGKSVCYQVPALASGGLTLVVTPLVSLMEDQVGRAREAGLRADYLSATRTSADREAIAGRAGEGTLDTLFVAPERLESGAFRAFLAGLDVRLLAVDEAHCISEWGHDFRPAYRRIASVRGVVTAPTLALTATATPTVRDDIVDVLALRDPLIVVRSFDRPNLSWSVARGGPLADRVRGIRRLLREAPGCAVVYAPTRRTVERVRDRLAECGVRTEAYHAGLPGEERSRVQAAFMADECRVVVATNAFGMGIDKPDVRLVVHVQLPGTLESYYQEAGRAGRDGEPARCVAFHGRADRRLAMAFIERTHPRPGRLAKAHARLSSAADRDRIVDPAEPSLSSLIGEELESWVAGDPVGLLGALERVGAVRRVRPARARAGTAPTPRLGVRRSWDSGAAERHRRRALDKLRAVERFARTRGCRRGALLGYFGEEAPTACGRCDRCRRPGRARSAPAASTLSRQA